MTTTQRNPRWPAWWRGPLRRAGWPALACLGALVATALAFSPARQCVRAQTLVYARTTYALVPDRAEAAAEIHCLRNGNKAMSGEPRFYRVPPRR